MPATRLDKERESYAQFVFLIRQYTFAAETSLSRVATKIGISPSWMYKKMKRPSTFTAGEINRIVRTLNIPPDAVRECVIWES